MTLTMTPASRRREGGSGTCPRTPMRALCSVRARADQKSAAGAARFASVSMESMDKGPVMLRRRSAAGMKKAGGYRPLEYRARGATSEARLLDVLADQAGHLEHRDLRLAEDVLQLGVGVDH